MEPLPVVDLNNTAVRLDSELQALESAVLLKLCKQVLQARKVPPPPTPPPPPS